MKCVICHGEDIQTKDINEELRVENDIVLFPVKIPVCRNCGERYYDRKTIQLIERVKLRIKTEVPHLKETGKILQYDIETEKLIA